MIEDTKEAIGTCYHCGNTGILKEKSSVMWKNEEVQEVPNGEIIHYELLEHINWVFLECPVCHNPTLLRKYALDVCDEPEEITTAFPKVLFNKKGVPNPISTAFDSAVKTKGIDFAICLLSLRRVLEMICKDKNADGKNLENKIEDLVNKKVLPDMLIDACWIIRHLGNDVAHADDVKFHSYDVEQVIEYVATIIEYLYSLPYRMREMKTKIEAQKTLNKK